MYDREGIRIGLEADPSVHSSSQAGLNDHPIDLNPKELEALLQPIQVSGYSGTITGLIAKPQVVPLFTPQELATISPHLTTAFREASPTERVSFLLPKPNVTYSEDRTVGSLFFRGPSLHVVLTDHSSIIRTDTGGGDYKDIRDTKGLKMSVAGSAHEGMLSGLEEPRWAPFERVHLSLIVKEVLARKAYIPAARTNQGGTGSLLPLPAAVPSENRQGSMAPNELQRQIRELSGTNEELRGRLDDQNKRMQQLKDQVEELRRKLPKGDSKGQPYEEVPNP